MIRRLAVVGAVALLSAMVMVVGPVQAEPSTRAACPDKHEPGKAYCMTRIHTDAQAALSSHGINAIHSAYNIPYTTSHSGARTIAIVDAFSNPNVVSDLHSFESHFGLPLTPTCSASRTHGCIAVLNQNGNTSPLPPTNQGWGLEIDLDVQMAAGLCNDCRINLYEANSNSFANLEAAVNKAAQQGANAISNSYGAFGSQCNDSAYNHPHVVVTVSAGDSGFGVACPASSNHVVSVGGTHLDTAAGGQYLGETVWNGTGSGCTSSITANSWQAHNAQYRTAGCGGHRAMNDVSMVAENVSVYDSFGFGGLVAVDGTSISAPLIATVYELAYNGTAVPKYPSVEPYTRGTTHNLNDPVNGSNGSCSPVIQCNGGRGWDAPTGMGTPHGLGAFTN